MANATKISLMSNLLYYINFKDMKSVKTSFLGFSDHDWLIMHTQYQKQPPLK